MTVVNRFTTGVYEAEGKAIPGAYGKVRSGPSGEGRSDRGVVAIAMGLDWFKDSDVVRLTKDDFYTNYMALFARDKGDEELLGLREIFRSAETVLLYRLNNAGTKATVTVGTTFTITAKNVGTRGNDLSVRIAKSTTVGKYDVTVYLDGKMVDYQTVTAIKDLIDSRFVDYTGTGDLSDTHVTATKNLSGGTNGNVTTSNHTDFLSKLERLDYNVLACTSTDDTIKDLYAEHTIRLRDTKALPVQVVIHGKLYDHIGVISLKNPAIAEGKQSMLVCFHAGIEAAVPIEQDLANKIYDGELKIEADYSDELLELYLGQGWAVYGKTNAEPFLIQDINSFISFTPEFKKDFRENQVVRVTDYTVSGIFRIFNTEFLGKINNNQADREGFRSRVLSFLEELANKGAIVNLEVEDFIVEPGSAPDSVRGKLNIQPSQSMKKLYLDVLVF